MNYPYSEKGLTDALKEVRGDIDSPFIWETLYLTNVQGRVGLRGLGTYAFKTEDGKEYEITVEGDYCLGLCHKGLFKPQTILSLKEKS